jgi:uncharacterized membrane protein YkoI
MHAKAAIVAGIAVAVLGGGGLALAQGDGGTAAAGGTTQAADVRAAATVSRSEAERIALTTAGGGRVREIELESEEGALVWKVEVIARGVRHDVYIDARSGKVVRHQVKHDRVRRDDDGPRHDAGDDHGGLSHDAADDHGSLSQDDGRNGADDPPGDDHGGGGGDDDGGNHGGDDGGGRGEG